MSKLNPSNTQVNTQISRTENDAIAHVSTGNAFVDFFGTFGSMRGMAKERIQDAFNRVFTINPVDAVKLLFYFRDAREGAKEKQIFLDVYKQWIDSDNELAYKLLPFVPEFGYWKDINNLIEYAYEKNMRFSSFAMGMYAIQLKSDLAGTEGRSLAGKWVFDENYARKTTKNKAIFNEFLKICKELTGISSKEDYRKAIVKLRKELNVVEVKMSAQQWNEIDFASVPAKAHNLYRKALQRHDPERYAAYMAEVEAGTSTIKAQVLTPVELIKPYVKRGSWSDLADTTLDRTVEAQWKALPDYVSEDVLVMADTSSSMFAGSYSEKSGVDPIHVSIALGVYLAQRNKGAFKNEVVTFDSQPEFVTLSGKSLHADVEILKKMPWGGSTNVSAAFDLILKLAKKNNVKPEDMPKYLMVVSDMQFDSTGEDFSPASRARAKFVSAGYEMPRMIWWNVEARSSNTFPEPDRNGTFHISGFSPAVLRNVFRAIDGNTMDAIQEILDNPRYAFVEALI